VRRVEREARVVEKPFVPLMPHKQYNSTEQSGKRVRKRSRACKLLFRRRDGWNKDVGLPITVMLRRQSRSLHVLSCRLSWTVVESR